MTAGREDGTAGELGRLRTSRAEREQAADVLNAAFIQGRLTKDELDLRVGRAFASRTYADLEALTADIPWVTTAELPAKPDTRGPGKAHGVKAAVGVAAVGAIWGMAAATMGVVQSAQVPPAFGVVFVAVTGAVLTGLLTALVILISWAVRRRQRC